MDVCPFRDFLSGSTFGIVKGKARTATEKTRRSQISLVVLMAMHMWSKWEMAANICGHEWEVGSDAGVAAHWPIGAPAAFPLRTFMPTAVVHCDFPTLVGSATSTCSSASCTVL